jgi:alpha-1,3-rhamnosyl/mannosyltransferase
MAIRVAFNATPLLSPLTGIGNYIVELGRALDALGDVDAYSFYRYRWRHEIATPPGNHSTGARGLLLERLRPYVPFRGSLRVLFRHLGFRAGLRRFGIELYHEQNYVPLAYDVPLVLTIHDLSWLHYPEAHPVDRVRWLERGVPRALERASQILVDSEFVRQELIATFGLDASRIHTAHLGVSDDFRVRSSTQTQQRLAPLGLVHGGYVLTVGTIEPRKNLAHIAQAYQRLPHDLRQRYPLVIAGAKGWRSADMMGQLRALADPQVRFVGSVERATLCDLYAGAALFAFPSLYEGFGLPPLEAMASGAPVIISDRASMPEVVGEAGETMDPRDIPDTTARLRALLEDPAKRQDMASRGLDRASRFTWARCARITRVAYDQALTARAG